MKNFYRKVCQNNTHVVINRTIHNNKVMETELFSGNYALCKSWRFRNKPKYMERDAYGKPVCTLVINRNGANLFRK